jgi:hypothetical protein
MEFTNTVDGGQFRGLSILSSNRWITPLKSILPLARRPIMDLYALRVSDFVFGFFACPHAMSIA